MCKYCERRTDVEFGWEQPKLPYHGNPPCYNLMGNVLDNEKWNATILDYQTSSPLLSLTCTGYFDGEGVGTIDIPIKYCPECGRKLGKSDETESLPYETLEELRSHYCKPIDKYITCGEFGNTDGMNGSCLWCREMMPIQFEMCSDASWLRNLINNKHYTQEEAEKFIDDYKQRIFGKK